MTSPRRPRHHPSEPDFMPIAPARPILLFRQIQFGNGATVTRYRRATTHPRRPHPDARPPDHREAS